MLALLKKPLNSYDRIHSITQLPNFRHQDMSSILAQIRYKSNVLNNFKSFRSLLSLLMTSRI